MKIPHLFPLCAAALLCTPIFAEDGDQARTKLKDLEERAHAAKEQGHAEEAKELMQQARRLHAEMGGHGDKGGFGEKLEVAKRRIEDLHKEGKHEEAEKIEGRLHAGAGKMHEQARTEAGPDSERKQHVMEAIKHLHAAGLHEAAERLGPALHEGRKDGDKGQREHRGPEGARPPMVHEPMQNAMGDMQKQMQTAMREMQEQMAKMAHTIDELRAEVGNKHHGDGERRRE